MVIAHSAKPGKCDWEFSEYVDFLFATFLLFDLKNMNNLLFW